MLELTKATLVILTFETLTTLTTVITTVSPFSISPIVQTPLLNEPLETLTTTSDNSPGITSDT